MTIDRRNFLRVSAAAAGVAAAGCSSRQYRPPYPPQKATLNLSCQEWLAVGDTLPEKLDFLEAHGYTGLEVSGRGLASRIGELQRALSGRTIRISAICAGFEGWLIAEDPAARELAVKSMKEILTAAGELRSTGLIIVPAFNSQKSLPHKESRELLLTLLADLGDHAQTCGTRILLEPLNRREAYFLRQVADGASICRDVDNAGIALMGDFWHMTWEETSDMGAFISAGDYLHHVHIASRKRRKMPGEDEGDNYIEGLRGLKMIGYRDFISLECGSIGDKKDTVPAAAALIGEQWAQA
ncbi:sugar phosphate isomerase/epimerase [bacterium]|nr:sugar phosphate isomerase/epimerase [bacterium]